MKSRHHRQVISGVKTLACLFYIKTNTDCCPGYRYERDLSIYIEKLNNCNLESGFKSVTIKNIKKFSSDIM